MKNKSAKFIVALVVILAVAAGAFLLYKNDARELDYTGIPAVDCIDYTKPVVQNYSLGIRITVNGKNYPLAPDIGHDRGNCLRSIRTDDASGVVKVQSVYSDSYTLGEFFNVWHKTFSDKTLLGRKVGAGDSLRVLVNGAAVDSYEKTPLTPGAVIDIIYSGSR